MNTKQLRNKVSQNFTTDNINTHNTIAKVSKNKNQTTIRIYNFDIFNQSIIAEFPQATQYIGQLESFVEYYFDVEATAKVVYTSKGYATEIQF